MFHGELNEFYGFYFSSVGSQKGKVLDVLLCDGTQKSTLKVLQVMSFPDFTPNLEDPHLDSATGPSGLQKIM